MEELWKDIPNYDGYQVSNFGRVRTHNKITKTNKHGLRRWKDKILKFKVSTNKYGRKDYRVELWQDGTHKTYLVARLVAFTFYNESLESKLTVNHIDGNSLNNNINNLEIITRKENIQHAYKNGLYSNMIKIKIIDKSNHKESIFSCLNQANKYINKSNSYLSAKIKKNIFENDNYLWNLI